MDYLNTLHYDSKRRKILDGEGYVQDEKISVNCELVPPSTIIGAGGDTKVELGLQTASDEVGISVINKSDVDGKLSVRAESTGVVNLVNQRTNYVSVDGTTSSELRLDTKSTNSAVPITLQPKGGGSVYIGDPAGQHLELSANAIKSKNPQASNTELKIKATGTGGKVTLAAQDTDKLSIIPGSGSSTLSATDSTSTSTNIELIPIGNGKLNIKNKLQVVGAFPPVDSLANMTLTNENTTNGALTNIAVSCAGGGTPAFSWDINGVTGRSLAYRGDGTLHLTNSWKNSSGTDLMVIGASGKLSPTVIRSTIQCGVDTDTSSGWHTVSFAQPFETYPTVIMTVAHTTASRVRLGSIRNITTTGFDCRKMITNTDGVSNWAGSANDGYWIAYARTQ